MSSLPPDPLAPDPNAPGGAEPGMATSGVPAALAPADLPWWPRALLPQALGRLAGRAAPGPLPADPAAQEDWVDWALSALDLRRDASPCLRAGLSDQLDRMAQGLLWHPDGLRFLVLLARRRLLDPSGRRQTVTPGALARAILPPPHPSLARQAQRIARLVPMPDLAHRLADLAEARHEVGGIWRLHRQPRGLAAALVATRVPQMALAVLTLAALVQGAEVALWARLGRMALGSGGGGIGMVLGLLFLPVVLGLAAHLCSDRLALRLAVALRRRLVEGALALPSDALRRDGAEGMLARGMEAQGFEAAVTSAALGSLGALAMAGWAAWALAQGSAGPVLLPLFLALLGVQAVVMRAFLGAARDWTLTRRGLTAQMIEWLIGHRSLPMLGPARQVLDGVQPALAACVAAGARMDRRSLLAFAVLPNGWTLAALAAALVTGQMTGPVTGLGEGSAARAVTLGGVILAARSFVAVAGVLASLGAARIAFDQISPLWRAADADRNDPRYAPPPASGQPILTLSRAALARPARALRLQVSLTLGTADRVWLTGASGAGKSSAVRLLTGAEPPQAGQRLGPGGTGLPPRHDWRVAALVPQFQDNHVFNGSLAFNLLLGRGWPASAQDLDRAEAVAQAVGLGPVIDRMPGRLSTHLGETGWQLSQGERSRLFLARAILQDAQALALDESLAALDPATEAECLDVLEALPQAVVLVRHD